MVLRALEAEEVKTLYDTALTRDFPAGECKPLAAIAGLMARGLYEPLEMRERGGRAAYAFQTVLPGCPSALVDYFAVEPPLRGGGVGTRALRALAGRYAGRCDTLLLECEHPAEAPDPAAARRRIGFYLRAGARATALESRVFGCRYLILALPCCAAPRPDAALCADLKILYRAMVPVPYARGSVLFWGE